EQVMADTLKSYPEEQSRVRIRINGPLPAQIMIAPNEWAEILQRILQNALRFAQKGWITLHVEAKSDSSQPCIAFCLEDEGPGMPTEEASQVFEPFFQGKHEPDLPSAPGLGLGLAICAGYVVQLKGEIFLESEVDKGTRVKWLLPYTRAINLTQQKNQGKEKEDSGVQSLKILVVEDNPINQKVTLHLLKKLNLKADIADNGQKALHKIQEQAYDLILMDLQMPVMNGLDATKAIRQNPDLVQPVIIAVTANSTEADRLTCQEAGMDDFLTKPLKLDELEESLKRKVQLVDRTGQP
ncbi:MAG: response regulator, partial [Bacteroidota bacterium]